MNAKDLKNSILQLAIQGKLVEQREEEGTARELLEKIEAEKKQLIKEGKIKKQKALPPIKEDDIPFDIPESWEWVRLGDASQNIHYGYTASASAIGDCKLLRITDIQNNDVQWEYVPYCNVKEKDYVTYGLNNRDIMIARTGGTIGKTYIVKNLNERAVFASYLIRVIPVNIIDETYLKKFMESPLYWLQLKAGSMGTGQPNVNGTTLSKLVLPLPPLAEQKRIVAKIEELMPFIDKYDLAYSEVEELNKKFPEDIQKSILQYAIQGKLVDQREEDGTAEDLYKQIQEEKKRLIKEGKIKKTKNLPEITEDEIPFDIPENWKWVRVGDIGSWSAGATPLRSNPKYYGGDIPWLKTGDLNDGYIMEVPEFISEEALEKTSVRLNPIGSVLMAMYGATIGKLGILNIEATTNQACCACIPYSIIYNKYLFYYLMGQRRVYIKMGAGGAQPNISKEKIINSIVPLPPLEEQKRIVAKIEELVPCTKQIDKKV